MALVAERRNPASGENEILGVGRLTRILGTNDAEVAVLVSDQFHGRGLGKELLARLVIVGARREAQRLEGGHPARQPRRDAHLRKAGLHPAPLGGR